MVHDPVPRARARVHADEERGVATFLQEARVLRPLLLHDELAGGVEQVRDQRVERPALPRAVAVHDDDLRGAGRLRAANGGVDLLGVEPAAFLVHRVAARRLLPLDDAGDALHVADDVHFHASPPCLAAFARDMISVDDRRLRVRVLLHVFPVARRQLPLRGRVALPVGVVPAEPVAKQHHPVRLLAAGREDVEIDVRVRPLEEPVLEPLRLADLKYVAGGFEVGHDTPARRRSPGPRARCR